MLKRLVLFIGLALVALPLHAAPTGTAADSLLVKNARIVDPAAQTIQEGALLIRGERVTDVLDQAPEGFEGRVLDVRGKWVIPGLVDGHVHSHANMGPVGQQPRLLGTAGSAKMMLYAGVTGFLDLFGPDSIFDLRDRQRSEGFRGADIYAAGPILTAPEGHGTQFPVPTRTVASPEEARRTVGALAERQPDVVKFVYIPRHERIPSIDQATMEALVQAAQARGLKTVAHVGSWKGAHETVAAGADAITHTVPAPPPDSLLRAMKRRGTYWIPTLAVYTEFAHLAQHPERFRDPLLRAVVDSALIAAYRDTASYPPAMQKGLRRMAQRRGRVLRPVSAFAEAGIPIMAGTDAGNPGVFQGFSLHRELVLLVQAGLSPWEALAAATTVPGQFLGAPYGLQPGDRANLVVLSASPIEDIRHTQQISRVIYRGRVVERTRLIESANALRDASQ